MVSEKSILYATCICQAGEQKFKLTRDFLQYDQPNTCCALQFSDEEDGKQFYYYLNTELKPLKEFVGRPTSGFALLEQKVSQPIVTAEETARVTAGSRNRQLSDIVRSSYQLFLTSDPNSPEAYVAAVSLHQQIQRGLCLEELRNDVVRKTLEVLNANKSAVATVRCLRLLQTFCQQDSSIISGIIEGQDRFSVDGLGFFGIMREILLVRSVNIDREHGVVLINDELLKTTLGFIASLFCHEFYYGEEPEVQIEGRSIHKIYSAIKSSVQKIKISLNQLDHNSIQGLVNDLMWLIINISSPQKDYICDPVKNIIKINQVLMQQVDLKDDLFLSCIQALHYVTTMVQNAEKKAEQLQQKYQNEVCLPTLHAEDISSFLAELISQMDIETACFVSAYQSEKMLQYYVETDYMVNFTTTLSVLTTLIKNSLRNQQFFLTASEVLLQQTKLATVLKYLYFISSSGAFFMDAFQVSLYDNLDIKYFTTNLLPFLQNYIELLISIRDFLAYYQQQSLDTNKVLSEANFIVFSCISNISVKSLICLKKSEQNWFSLQFKCIHESDIFFKISSNLLSFYKLLQANQYFDISSSFIQELFGQIRYILENINESIQGKAHLTVSLQAKLMSFAIEIFCGVISVLTVIMKRDDIDMQVFYDVGILDVLCNCVQLDVVKQCQSLICPENSILVDQFSENMILLFKILMIDRIKDMTDANQSQNDIINLIKVLPLLLEFQFAADRKPNVQMALDEIKLFDNLILNVVSKLIVEQNKMSELIEASIYFGADLAKFALQYGDQVDILQLNIIKTFVDCCFTFFDKRLDPSLQQQIYKCMRENVSLKDVFKIICLVMRIVQVMPDELEIQQLSQKAFEVFLNFYNLPGNLKLLIQFMFDDIHQNKGNLVKEFIKLAYNQIKSGCQDEFKRKVQQLVSLIVLNTIEIISLDLFNKNSVIQLESQGIKVLTEKLSFENLCVLYIDRDEEVYDINSKFLNTKNVAKLPQYASLQDDFLILNLCKQLLIQDDSIAQINSVFIAFLTVQKLRNKIKLFSTEFEADSDLAQVRNTVDSEFVMSLLKILNSVSDTAFQKVLLKLLSYVFELVPTLEQVEVSSLVADALRLFTCQTPSKSIEYCLMCITKMIYRKSLKHEQKFEFEPCLNNILKYVLDSKKVVHKKIIYYCVSSVLQIKLHQDCYKVINIFLQNKANLANLISTVVRSMEQVRQFNDEEMTIMRQISFDTVSIIRNICNDATLLVTNPDFVYGNQASKPLVDSGKVKQQFNAALENNLEGKDSIMSFVRTLLFSEELMRLSTPLQISGSLQQIVELLNILLKNDATQAQFIRDLVQPRCRWLITLAVGLVSAGFDKDAVVQLDDEAVRVVFKQSRTIISQLHDKTNDMKSQHLLSQFMLQLTNLIYQVVVQQTNILIVEKLAVEVPLLVPVFYRAIKSCYKQYFIVFGSEQLQRQIQSSLTAIQQMAVNIVYCVLQTTEISKNLFLQKFYVESCEEISTAIMEIERPAQTQSDLTGSQGDVNKSGSSTELTYQRVHRTQQLMVLVRYYVKLLELLSQTVMFKEVLAQNSGIVVSCGRLLFMKKVAVAEETQISIAGLLHNLVGEQSIPILAVDNHNRGINGVPIFRVALNHLKNQIIDKNGFQKVIAEKLLAIIRAFLMYKGVKRDQCRNNVKPFLPECYQMCKEVAVLPGCNQCTEIAVQIVDLIERF